MKEPTMEERMNEALKKIGFNYNCNSHCPYFERMSCWSNSVLCTRTAKEISKALLSLHNEEMVRVLENMRDLIADQDTGNLVRWRIDKTIKEYKEGK